MNSTDSMIIHSFCAQNQPLSSATFAHVKSIFFIVGSGVFSCCWLSLEHPCFVSPFSCEIAGMVEAQFVELATAVHSVQAQLIASEAARSNLQAHVERLGRTIVERKIGVVTRNFGRLSHFNGIAGLVSGFEGRDAARGEAVDCRNQCGTLRRWTGAGEHWFLPFASAQHFGSCSGSCGERWVSRRTPCLTVVWKVRPTRQVENSRASLELAPIRLLWRHVCEARGV